MNKLRRIAAVATASAVVFGLAACSGGEENSDAQTIRVGALPVPAGEMLDFVNDNLAEEAGLRIEYVEFNDYNTPNPALSDGSTDANLFQNTGFMDTYNEQAGGELVSLGDVYLPAAAYHSREYTSFDDLPDGATIAVPNDPTNEGRALKMLAAAGLIEAGDDVHNLDGITSNPRGFEFLEVENATLPLALDDADVAFVTAAFAIPAGLTAETAILTETEDSEYYNALVTTADRADDPALQKLLELLTSQETADFINENWEGLIIPVVNE